MLIRNRMLSLTYKIVLTAVCLIGLLLNTGLIGGAFAPYVLLYYTVFGNLLCLIFYTAAIAVTCLSIKSTGKFGIVRFAPHFKGAVVVAMLMNTVLYVYSLFSSLFANAGFFAVLSNIIAGIIVPGMVVADWILFTRKGRFAAADTLIWTAVFFVWYCLVLIFAQLGLKYYGNYAYPYEFIDPDRITWAPVLVYVFLIALAFLALGLILFGADRWCEAAAQKRALAERQATLQDGTSAIAPADGGIVSVESLLNGRPAEAGAGAFNAAPGEQAPAAAHVPAASDIAAAVIASADTAPADTKAPAAPSQPALAKAAARFSSPGRQE